MMICNASWSLTSAVALHLPSQSPVHVLQSLVDTDLPRHGTLGKVNLSSCQGCQGLTAKPLNLHLLAFLVIRGDQGTSICLLD